MAIRPKIIAHRGASGNAPENTLSAIRLALEMGADLIEVDVHLSHDEEVVVIHDASLGRTSNGQGQVGDQTLTFLKTLDAGSWFDPAFAGEKIPTLEEVLSFVAGQATVLIEIKKGLRGLYSEIEAKVIEVVEKHKARNWVILQSFEPEVVKKIHQLDPELEHHKLVAWHLPRLWLHHDGKLRIGSVFKYPHVQAINIWFRSLSQNFVQEAHNRGLKVFTYTVNKEEVMRQCMELQVDGIITNFPQRLKALLDGHPLGSDA